MKFTVFLAELAAALDTKGTWLAVLALGGLLIAWGAPRSPQAALVLLLSLVPGMLVVALLDYIFGAIGTNPRVPMNIIAVRVLPAVALVLFACSLVAGAALLLRAPLPRARGLLAAIIICYAIVTATYFSALARELASVL